MARLTHTALASLDGYVADADGNSDWAAPDEEVHAVVNDLERSSGTFLLGRRMYDVLVAWETMDTVDEPASIQDFAEIWRAADKIVTPGVWRRFPARGRGSIGPSTPTRSSR
jgi:dihydrofolate reductase